MLANTWFTANLITFGRELIYAILYRKVTSVNKFLFEFFRCDSKLLGKL